ncbi:MAG: YHS domain-containing (seleno)protein [Aquabacterium sp.]
MHLTRRQILLLAAATPLGAHAQPEPSGPWRTIADSGAERLMLEGHDAVAYFTRAEAVRGDPALQAEHAGVSWRFASADNRAAFLREPARYMPQYGGYCSNGINYAIPGGGGGAADTWRIYRGRLFVFGGRKARDHFEMDTALNLQRADHYWTTEVAGANPTWQRLRRMVVQVPHYMSDAALQAEWEARHAAGTLPVMPGRPQVVPAAP